MKKIIFTLYIFLSATICSFSQTGIYDLFINNTPGWQNNSIEIKKFENSIVEGFVTIDWNIGPQARAPFDYEKNHQIPFSSKLNKNDNSFQAKVNVANMKDYIFNFYIVSERNDNIALSGFVKIINSQKKNSKNENTLGVIALKKIE